jgi:hypothetical protein
VQPKRKRQFRFASWPSGFKKVRSEQLCNVHTHLFVASAFPRELFPEQMWGEQQNLNFFRLMAKRRTKQPLFFQPVRATRLRMKYLLNFVRAVFQMSMVQ